MSYEIREFRTNFKPQEDLVSSRNELRKIVLNEFLTERPGTGRGEKASRHKYVVEELKDGRKIYLLRPAWLKVGFDFEIWVERWSNNEDKRPSHDDVLNDLRQKRKEKPQVYKKLHEAMLRIYNCEEPDEIIENYKELRFESGLSVELILKVIKWFFIEQDIRFWNFSGRRMFKEALDGIFEQTTL
jgi:hypothetical protein